MHRSTATAKRRGRWFRKGRFEERWPHKTINKDELIWRMGADKKMGYYVKVYNEDEGIEDFSEGEADEVAHRTVIDDGVDILHEDQVCVNVWGDQSVR